MVRNVMITGATSGIGEAAARLFAAEGVESLIVTGRRWDRLKALKKEIEAEYEGVDVLPLAFDIRDRKQCQAAVDSLPPERAVIDVLINNAGLAAGLDYFEQGDVNDWEAMIDTNVKGLLYISRRVIPRMVESGRGHVVNIGSIAGTQPYEKGAVYCASKHAVHALSQGMRIDLLGKGVKVTEIRPGMVKTEFSLVRFHGDVDRADSVYRGVTPLTGEDVADAVLWAVLQPPHVNVDEIVLTPAAQANAYYTFRQKGE
ncbi:MAG: SDR family NAD(P)-dependent oxidoreductase [Rikenellaceae bacterium]|nr:SDR family NAD(P)-dependent oxidoreductase [Rikenellaceae bacterium]